MTGIIQRRRQGRGWEVQGWGRRRYFYRGWEAGVLSTEAWLLRWPAVGAAGVS